MFEEQRKPKTAPGRSQPPEHKTKDNGKGETKSTQKVTTYIFVVSALSNKKKKAHLC
jgi:hypothetical protein